MPCRGGRFLEPDYDQKAESSYVHRAGRLLLLAASMMAAVPVWLWPVAAARPSRGGTEAV